MQHVMHDGPGVSLGISQLRWTLRKRAVAAEGCPWSRGKTKTYVLQASGLTCTLQSWYRLDVPTQVLFPAPGTDFLLVGKRGTKPGLEWQLWVLTPALPSTSFQ